jgi:hypothetical protein
MCLHSSRRPGDDLAALRFEEQLSPDNDDDLMKGMRMQRRVPQGIGLNDARAVDFGFRPFKAIFDKFVARPAIHRKAIAP